MTIPKGSVVRLADGCKVVVRNKDGMELPEGATVVCDKPHGETDENGNPSPDFSYCCGWEYCRCMQ